MHILILNWRDTTHPLAGGAEIALMEHAKYWREKGATVTWIAASYLHAKEKEIIDGISFLRMGSQYTVHFLTFFALLRKKVSNFDTVIDCFHFIPFFTPLYLHNRKIIAYIHEVAGTVWYDNIFWPLSTIGYYIEPLFFKFYKNIQFMTVSESSKKELIEVGIDMANISIIHNGITLSKQIKEYKKEKDPTILFMNRISKDKGIMDALKAYEIVAKNNKTVTLWVAGKEQDIFSDLLSSMNITSNVRKRITYFGFVSEERKFELLQRAWILIHPSKKEGWGLTVIEANSMGTPVVGYDVPGLKDSICNNITGLLVDRSPEALSHGIESVVTDTRLYVKLQKNAMQWAKQFTWEKSAKESWGIINNE